MELNELKFGGSNRPIKELIDVKNIVNNYDVMQAIFNYVFLDCATRDEVIAELFSLDTISIDDLSTIIDWCDEVRQELL